MSRYYSVLVNTVVVINGLHCNNNNNNNNNNSVTVEQLSDYLIFAVY